MKKKISYLGKLNECEEIEITSLNEPFGEIHLADGAILKTKTSILEVVSIAGSTDLNQNPTYVVIYNLSFTVKRQPGDLND